MNQTGAQGRILYGTDQFQVRFWQIPPGRFPVAASPDSSNFFLVKSELRLEEDGPVQQGRSLVVGQPLSLHNRAAAWENTSSETAEVLELCWLSAAPRQEAPLKEITEERPWGSFTVLEDEPHYKLKRLMVKPGNRLSLQRHQHREEHWIITQGRPEITLNGMVSRYEARQYIYIPLQAWHRIANPGAEPVEIIELQLGESFEETDIERREDDYGRC